MIPAFRLTAADRVLVLSPHPDDETLATGVLLQRAHAAGAAVRVLLATDGEANVWVQRLAERRIVLSAQARTRFAARRRAEGLAALAVLGIPEADVRFLGLPDDGITEALLNGEDAGADRLAEAIEGFEPTVLVTPSPADLHPDHSALGVLVRLALSRPGACPAPTTRLEYVVHGRGAPCEQALVLTPDAKERRTKRSAISRHAAPLLAHRREFLARCGVDERFALADERSPLLRTPPLRRASVLPDGSLEIEIASRPRLGAWGPTTLHVLGVRDGRILERIRVPLAWRRGAASVARSDPRVPAPRPARLRWKGGRGVVVLDPSALPGGDVRYAKIERRFGFYDEGGWAEVPTTREETVAAPTPSPAPHRALRVVAVVPCYGVANLCGAVVREAARVADRVIAVDDGSTDGTGDVLRAAAEEAGRRVEVLAFPSNRGKGVALLAAFRRALEGPPFDVLVTLDGDGQHRPADVPRVAAAVGAGAALAIGGRRFGGKVPLRSRLGNKLTSALLRRLYPRCPPDTQSGLRGHRRDLVEAVVREVAGRRYETELEILLLALRSNLPVASVPIPTLYADGNESSHFRPLADSCLIYRALLASGLPRGRASRRRRRGPGAAAGLDDLPRVAGALS